MTLQADQTEKTTSSIEFTWLWFISIVLLLLSFFYYFVTGGKETGIIFLVLALIVSCYSVIYAFKKTTKKGGELI